MKLEGLDNVISNFDKLKSESKKVIHDLVVTNAEEMATDAKNRAPHVYKFSGGGEMPTNAEVINSIVAIPTGEMKASVYVNSRMGAYAEFGTGAFVDVPQGWEHIAWSYYVNGKGLMLPTPYFYPAYRETQKRFLNDIKNYLNTLEESR